MRLHVLQHVAFEDEANIGLWAKERGHTVARTCLYAKEPLPASRTFDALAVMGGPMNVYEYDQHPWLYREKTFILDVIEMDLPVLGVCLGAQLIADVLGGRVRRNPQPEIGWFPVTLTPEGRRNPLFDAFPRRFEAFHWHGDTFEVPAGATHVAGSEACRNQAFICRERVVGLQFHMEYSQASIETMIRECADDLQPGPSVQSADEILSDPTRPQSLTERLLPFLDAWAGA